jgi:surface antigen
MVGSFVRLAAAAFFSLLLAGCAGQVDLSDDGDGAPRAHAGARSAAGSPLECVPYARDKSGIQIYGDAYTWWDKAEGHFARSTVPSPGAVMVLYNYAGPARAHVAVVKQVVGAREIRIDHANWLDDGAIYTDDPVRDVSPSNDWSQVRVFNIRNQAWGGRVYPVQGFIGPGPSGDDVMVARNPPPRTGDAIARLLADQDDLAADEDDLTEKISR